MSATPLTGTAAPPQAIAMQAKPPLMITHSPGHMFITDRRHSEYEV